MTERTPDGKVGSSWLSTISGPARSRLCITGSTSTQVGQSRLATMTRPSRGRSESGMAIACHIRAQRETEICWERATPIARWANDGTMNFIGGDFKGWHSRGYLPHFDSQDITQFVTFR